MTNCKMRLHQTWNGTSVHEVQYEYDQILELSIMKKTLDTLVDYNGTSEHDAAVGKSLAGSTTSIMYQIFFLLSRL